MNHFVKTRLPDLVLCTLISLSLCMGVFSGFVLTDSFSSSLPAVFGVCLVLTALCIVFSYRRLTVGIGIGILVIAAVAVVVAMYQNDALLSEEENSLFIALLISFCSTVLTFLLSRSRVGCVFLFLLGMLLLSGAAFLAFPVPLWAFLLFLFCCPVLFLCRVYTAAVRKADAGSVRLKGYVLQCLTIALCALLLSSGIFYAAVKPLNPPTMDLRLIQLLRSMEPLQVLGVARTHEVITTELQSEDIQDEEQSDEEGEEEDDSMQNTQFDYTETDTPTQSSEQEQVASVYYPLYERSGFWLIIVGVIVLIVCVFVGRVHLIRRRHRLTVALPHSEAVLRYYPFFLNRLSKCGISRREGKTLSEFASDSAAVLEPFDEGDSSFRNLTTTYEKLLYGGISPSDEEYEQYESYYSRFYRNLKKEKGTLKYLLQIFRF